MKTLAAILHDADPIADEPRAAQARAVTRTTILSAPRHPAAARPMSRRRVLALAGALSIAGIASTVFLSRHASVDVIAAVRFEARLKGTTDVILRNSDIARAQVVPAEQAGLFDITLTFTAEGAKRLREATRRNIGRALEMLIDGKVVMAPTIRAAIPDESGNATITGTYTRAEAERIVSGIVGQ